MNVWKNFRISIHFNIVKKTGYSFYPLLIIRGSRHYLNHLTFANGKVGSGQFTEEIEPEGYGQSIRWGKVWNIFRLLNSSVSFPLCKTKEFPLFSSCSSKSQIPHCLEIIKYLFLYPLSITHAHSSIITPTPQKNKISVNHLGMIQGFRLKDKVIIMSDLWWSKFLIHQERWPVCGWTGTPHFSEGNSVAETSLLSQCAWVGNHSISHFTPSTSLNMTSLYP